MARGMFYPCWLNTVIILLLIITKCRACLFKRQTADKLEDLLKQRTPPWEKKNGRDVDEHCECGLDIADASDPEPDVNKKHNNPIKSWQFYIHVFSGPGLGTDHVRTCPGTIINSRMGLTSHNCLKLRNESVQVYETWHPPPRNMLTSTMPAPENLLLSQTGNIIDLNEENAVPAGEIIYNGKFMYSDALHYPIVDEDVAIIVFRTEFPITIFPPICVSENYPNDFDLTGYRAYYYGIGGVVDADPTPEDKFVPDLVVIPGKLCDDQGNKSLCVQYRSPPPTLSGGALIMSRYGSLNKLGFSPDQTVFLIGLASHAINERPGTTITSTIFTNILPFVNHLEYYGNKVNAKWCKTPSLQLDESKRQDSKSGIVKLYPWEDTKQFPSADYLERDESLGCVCGLHNLEKDVGSGTARIVGGVDAKPYEFPWMAFYLGVYYEAADVWKPIGFGCGSSIINDRVILTAAHCVLKKDRLGKFPDQHALPNRTRISYRLHQKHGDEQEIIADAEEIFYFPDYIPGSIQDLHDSDIALIVLKEPITFSSAKKHGEAKAGDIRPICLPKRNKHLELEGRKGTVIGWGVTPTKPEDIDDSSQWEAPKNLQKLDNVPIYSLGECAKRTPFSVRDSVICAGFWDRKRDFTQGDSGGPFAVRSNSGFWVQVGVVSYYYSVLNMSDPYDPKFQRSASFYTNIEKFLDFIDFTSRKAGAKWCKDRS